MQNLGAVIGIVVGVVLIVARKAFAHAVVVSQNAVWRFHFGDKERKISEFIAVLVGLGLLVLSTLALLGILRVKGTP
jgi:ABC-type nickel/cobalt efflux system permease component RcnA